MGELLLLLFLAFVVIGPSDFPKVAKGLLKAVRYTKSLAAEIIKSFTVDLEDEAREIKEAKDIIESTVKSVETNGALDPVKNEMTSIAKEFSELAEVVDAANKNLEKGANALIKGE